MIPLLQNFKTIVLADGVFPSHEIPLRCLRDSERIICCDGAVLCLLESGKEPDYIVGDLDSISDELKQRFFSILYHDPCQETNDLTKSVQFCMKNAWKEITILGATGKREDHTLGNLSLLTDYSKESDIQLITDFGVFVSQTETAIYESYPGQQVSIFSFSPETFITTKNLLYPIHNKNLTSWWQGTLNESASNCFSIEINQGKVLVFRKY